MSVAFAGSLDRAIVLAATDRVGELISHPHVGHDWHRESRCEGMTVGGLTRHLIQQPQRIVDVVTAPTPDPGDPVMGLTEYYRQPSWSDDLDDAAHTANRDTANTDASTGYAAAVHDLAGVRARLADVLGRAGGVVRPPWQSGVFATDDFLVTRLMEMVVHSDDLATSVGLPTPAFGPAIVDPVVRLLAALSVNRHGEVAIIRALTRPQRASRDITAF